MPSEKKRPPPPRQEYEVAWYTKELGRSLQRKMLTERLADFSDSRIPVSAHGEDPAPEVCGPLPRDERAG